MSIQEQLLNIEQEAIGKIAAACTQIELNDLRAFYMGKKSPLGEIMKSMATLSIEDKKIIVGVYDFNSYHFKSLNYLLTSPSSLYII